MEVLVLIDFEGTIGDELTVRAGDVVSNVTLSNEEGWMEGELRGKRGIFPVNFVQEVPVNLLGDSQREPRSLRKPNMLMQQCRICEVKFAYTPMHQDELELVVGETIELLKEIEDGWWMGKKNGKIGAFPSNFVTEIFVSPKDTKLIEGKSRPKLSDAIFSKEGTEQQRASIRKKTNVKETCKVMFDYSARAEDELDLKKGDIVTLISKVSEDDGWWEGELNGRRGFFPDNFVMLIPMDVLQEEKQRPLRRGSEKQSEKQASGMDKSSTEANTKTETKDEKAEAKDLRSDPPGKIKLPGMVKPIPPPVKNKPTKFVTKPSDDQTPPSPKPTDSKPTESDQFDGVDVSSAKLSHLTANRAKPPQRRPPTGLGTGSHPSSDSNENAASVEADGVKKATEDHSPSNNGVVTPPQQPAVTKVQEEKPSLEYVLAELKELRMALELFKTQHETDMKDLKDELQEERNKRMKLQDEVQVLRKQK